MATPIKIRIKKRAFTRRVKNKVEQNLKILGQEIRGALQVAVDDPFPPASVVGDQPHRRSGDLKRGFKFVTKQRLFSVDLRVFTNVVYAARLEFGFVGRDRAGRNINQGPRPYWRPVLSNSRIGPRVARP